MNAQQLIEADAKIAAYQSLPPAAKKFYQKLNKIQPGLGAKWLANVLDSKYRLEALSDEHYCINCIGSHFVWSATPQGFYFWYTIYNNWKENRSY